jgi:excisionase family DNA binding protein
MSKDFLTVKDVAQELGLTERTVRELFNTGVIKARKIAGKYVTTREIIKAYIEAEGEEKQ